MMLVLKTILLLLVLVTQIAAEDAGPIDLSISQDNLAVPKRLRAQAEFGRAIRASDSRQSSLVTAKGAISAVTDNFLNLLDAGWNGKTSLDSVVAKAESALSLLSKRGFAQEVKRELPARDHRKMQARATTTTPTKTTTTTKTTTKTTTTTPSAPTLAPAVATPTTAPPKNTTPACAAKYTNSSTIIAGPGTLPRPAAFVKRSGQGLTLNGQPYRIVGPNIYWLCNDENIAGVPKGTPTEKGRIREALAIAVAMGANTVRLGSCGTSVGYPMSIEPSLGVFANATYLDVYDYAIYAANKYGLRVILPLTDNYDYYHGGKYSILRFNNQSAANFGAAFFNTNTAYGAFRDYIKFIMTRVNPYTGIAYGKDPTIMAWETGNEFGAYIGKEGYPPLYFTDRVAALIKSMSPDSLVIDGTDGFYNYTTKAVAPGVNSTYVDIMSDHAYPRSIALMNSQIPIAKQYNKAYLVGEFDWTGNFGGDDLATYLNAVLAQSYMGLMMWSVFGHDSQCCAYVTHSDGYSAYYPNGNTLADQQRLLLVTQFNYRATGRAVPASLPAVACPQPCF